MSDEKLTVTAVIRVRPGGEERFVEATQNVIPATRAESGCIDYRLHRHRKNRRMFVFYESWRSKADLDHHMETPHIGAFIAEIGPVLDGEIDVQLWHELAEAPQPSAPDRAGAAARGSAD